MEIHAGRPSNPVKPDPAVNLVGDNDKHSTSLIGEGDGDQPRGSALSSRRASRNSVESGVSKPSSMSDTCIRIDKLHEDNRPTVNLGPSCWHADPTSLPAEPEAAKLPSLPSGGNSQRLNGVGPPGLTPMSFGRLTSLACSYPGGDPGLAAPFNTSHLDLSGLMPSSVKRPREGIQPDTYPFGTLSNPKQPSTSTDPMEIMMERMGGRMGELGQSNNKEMKLERFQEYVVFDTRGFGLFKTTIGTGCYSGELEASLKRQSVTHREILSRQGVRVPVTNRIARASPLLDWGLDYGSTPGANTLMLNDFAPWPATKLDEFRISGDKLEVRGKAPASIYLVNASIEQHNKMFGAIYGDEHIAEREQARSLLIELNRRHDVLYTPEVAHHAFESMVRNFLDLIEEGVRRMLRVTRKGIRRESLAEYALLPREDGSPAWVFPNSFDMVSPSGFWQAKFIPRFDAKLENGLISNALKSGLAFSSSTDGGSAAASPDRDDRLQQFPIPGLLSEEEIKLSYAHAPMKDDTRICWDHSSWRSCRRGSNCTFNRSMIHTKNLHWIIRAQLAKRGGHRSQVRIAPDAAPGYIAALRETNTAGDGKDTTEPSRAWEPKSVGQEAGHRTGETVKPDVNPAVGEIPPDFDDIGFAALEKGLGQLAHGTDSWTEQNVPDELVPWHDRSVLTTRQTALESWWDQTQPRIDIHIEPWIMWYVDVASEPFSIELLKRGLSDLSGQGSSKQRLLAEEGLVLLNSAIDGHQVVTQSYWGKVLRNGDFPSQELTVACFHFHVIDFGDSIPIQDALMRSTGNIENVERNQCVHLHLAAGILWNESGRPKRVPGRGRVFTSVQELRRVELTNALLASESLRDDTSLEGMIVRSNAHDVCRPSRDRDFRTLGFFLSSVLTDRGIGCLRIFAWGEAPMDMMCLCISSRIRVTIMGPSILT